MHRLFNEPNYVIFFQSLVITIWEWVGICRGYLSDRGFAFNWKEYDCTIFSAWSKSRVFFRSRAFFGCIDGRKYLNCMSFGERFDWLCDDWINAVAKTIDSIFGEVTSFGKIGKLAIKRYKTNLSDWKINEKELMKND